MKKSFLALTLLLSLAVLGFGVWLQTPRSKNHQLVEAATVAFSDNFERIQKIARDPAQNGYLSETFLPYWGRKEIERDPNSEAGRVVRDWVTNHSWVWTGRAVEHKKLWDSQNTDYLEKRKAFEGLVPELVKAIEKPVFMYLSDELPVLGTEFPDSKAIAASVFALVAYADSEVALGRIDSALPLYRAAMGFGCRLQVNGLWQDLQLGFFLRSGATQSMLHSLGLESDLSYQQRREIVAILLENKSAPEAISLALGGWAQVTGSKFDAHQNGTVSEDDSSEQAVGSLGYVPGLVGRDKRIFLNQVAEVIEAQSNGSQEELLHKFELNSRGDFLGKDGLVINVNLPNPDKVSQRDRACRKLNLGAATCFLVREYQIEKAKNPTDLEQLLEGEARAEEFAPLKEWKATLVKGEDRWVLSVPLARDEAKFIFVPKDCEWIKKTNTTLGFEL